MKRPKLTPLQQIQAELRQYQPFTAAQIITDESHLWRRQQLWRRLDELCRGTGNTEAAA